VPSPTSAAAWPVEPVLFAVLGLGVLYGLGGRGQARRWWREAAFYGGLVTLVAVFDSPLVPLSQTSFAAHMTAHMLLLTVAPPLLLLGAPWPRVWSPLPVAVRGPIERGLGRARWSAPLRSLAKLLARPLPAWLVANAVLVVWHIPVLFDSTLHNGPGHALEHALFLVSALAFWAQVIDTPPVQARLDQLGRAVYVTGAMVVSWILALVLLFAPRALYDYAGLAHRAGGLSALSDQQLAAGIMWVPGSIAYTIAVIVCLYRWLEPHDEPVQQHRVGVVPGN
jgi:putative membrane protein